MFGIHLDDPPEVIHEKVAKGFVGVPRAADMCKVTMEHVIASKAIRDTRDYQAEDIKENLYGIALRAWENASAFPSVCVFDDAHWADQASVDLLVHVFRVTESRPMLFVCALRPERESPGWQIKVKTEAAYPDRYTEIVLSPLDTQRTSDLVSALLNIADLPRDLRELMIRKAEGNPYFVEEVVRGLIEQGIVVPDRRWAALEGGHEAGGPRHPRHPARAAGGPHRPAGRRDARDAPARVGHRQDLRRAGS